MVIRLSPEENPLENPFCFQVELFWFKVEPFSQRVLHGTQNGSSWNKNSSPMGTAEEKNVPKGF
jgi:hypothetical protein